MPYKDFASLLNRLIPEPRKFPWCYFNWPNNDGFRKKVVETILCWLLKQDPKKFNKIWMKLSKQSQLNSDNIYKRTSKQPSEELSLVMVEFADHGFIACHLLHQLKDIVPESGDFLDQLIEKIYNIKMRNISTSGAR